MGIVGIDHVQLAMPPGKEVIAREFYGNVLGLLEREKPDALALRGGCWFEAADFKLHLGVETAFRPALKAHPGLLVDDLASLAERLRNAEITVDDASPLDGRARCYVHDPFGNRLELIQV
jgi:catechol 2,3-dioxygenase-like lactoylglutathione lyase family enzyme